MAFSGALTLTDLNDYLGPSQACIKPVSGKDAPQEVDGDEQQGATASTEIAIDADGAYYESAALPPSTSTSALASTATDKPRARTRLETAEISLNDCLACSGCVTSAESVLIGLQSVDELRKVVAAKGLADGPTHLVASISPQSLASLSSKYSPSPRQMLAKVEDYLKARLGFDMIMDTTFARYLSLDEQAGEYYERKAESNSEVGPPRLPMLASACPGWICYAEKTHGELLPLISRTRSPQQMAGLLAKRYVIEEQGETAPRIYHMTVMPCYDKKLEASRQDFFDEVTNSRDVDLVITTGELDDMMRADGYELASMDDEMDEDLITPPVSDNGGDCVGRPIPSLLQQPGSSSGSYLFDLIRRVWLDHLSQANEGSLGMPSLSVKTIRSADYTEYVLRSSADKGGEILFKGAQCYGFRNLQNLVRKVQKQTGIKSKKASAALTGGKDGLMPPSRRGGRGAAARGGMVRRGGRGGSQAAAVAASAADSSRISPQEEEENRGYDFVEVMACPGGCVNGGGQIRPPGGAAESSVSSSLTTRTITTDVTEAIVEAAPPKIEAEESGKSLRRSGHLDPEGYSDGWLTPAASSTSEDVEMLAMGREEGTEEPEVAGWKGTTREWVRRVEKTYWGNDSSVTSVHQGQALGRSKEVITKDILAALVKSVDLSSGSQSKHVDALAATVVEQLCRARGKDEQRSDLLRTQYRAIQDEAVSGLAVQW